MNMYISFIISHAGLQKSSFFYGKQLSLTPRAYVQCIATMHWTQALCMPRFMPNRLPF